MDELKTCPICGSKLTIHGPEDWKPTFYDPDSGGDPYNAVCDCGFQFSIGYCEYDEFIKALNRRPAPENKPLTLEQLRQMDGEPVYITVCGRPDLDAWHMVRRTNLGVIAIGAAAQTIYSYDGKLTFEGGTYYNIEHGILYGKTWLAYARKPEQEAATC